MFLDKIESIGDDAVKKIEKEIARVKEPNGIIPPTEITLESKDIKFNINIFYTPDY